MGKRIVRYKCPYCDLRTTKQELVTHIEDSHSEMIPEGYSSFRVVFDYVNHKPPGFNGRCTECGAPSGWDENKGRYNRQCSNPACHKSYIKKFESNMNNKLGVSRITKTPDGLEKMLANRKISGTYKFCNGEGKSYTGSYEKTTLEFMDKVLHCDPNDIMTPGPILEYTFDEKKHLYITDIYYIPYNLIIEVKDGGKRPNGREMKEYRQKQMAKERFIIENTNYNYLRLTDNDQSQLLAVFADLKLQMVEHSGERVIHVNEAVNALTTGYMPGFADAGCVYVVNYMQNNAFSGEKETNYGVSFDPKLDTMFTRDKEGILRKNKHDDLLDSLSYSVFLANKKKKEEVEEAVSKNLDKFVDESFLYRTLFDKNMDSYDQIYTEENAVEIKSFEDNCNYIFEATTNYINYDPDKFKDMIKVNEFFMANELFSLDENKYYLQSIRNPELYITSDKEFSLKEVHQFINFVGGIN